MSLFFIQSSTLTNIANAIRSVTGQTGSIAVSQMANTIGSMTSGGGSGGGSFSPASMDYIRADIIGDTTGTLYSKSVYFSPPNSYANAEVFSAFDTVYEISMPSVSVISSYAFSEVSYLESVQFNSCRAIRANAFDTCASLRTAIFPSCTEIGTMAFYQCDALDSISFPACQSIASQAFCSCTALQTVQFPNCYDIGSYAFYYCSNLISVYFPAEADFGTNAFANVIDYGHRMGNYTYNLDLYLSGSAVGTAPSDVFGDPTYLTWTDIGGNSGGEMQSSNGGGGASSGDMMAEFLSIYVPASLVADFQTDWGGGIFSNNIFAWPT